MLLFPWRSILAIGCIAFAHSARSAPAKPAPIVLNKVGEYALLQGRQGEAAVAQGGFIYVFGGYGFGLLTDIERFDPRTNRSERVYDKLIPRNYHRAVEFKGKIYIFGGKGVPLPEHPFEDAVEIYDVVTNTVTRGAAMPEPRAHMATTRLGDKI